MYSVFFIKKRADKWYIQIKYCQQLNFNRNIYKVAAMVIISLTKSSSNGMNICKMLHINLDSVNISNCDPINSGSKECVENIIANKKYASRTVGK